MFWNKAAAVLCKCSFTYKQAADAGVRRVVDPWDGRADGRGFCHFSPSFFVLLLRSLSSQSCIGLRNGNFASIHHRPRRGGSRQQVSSAIHITTLRFDSFTWRVRIERVGSRRSRPTPDIEFVALQLGNSCLIMLRASTIRLVSLLRLLCLFRPFRWDFRVVWAASQVGGWE